MTPEEALDSLLKARDLAGGGVSVEWVARPGSLWRLVCRWRGHDWSEWDERPPHALRGCHRCQRTERTNLLTLRAAQRLQVASEDSIIAIAIAVLHEDKS